MNQRGMKVDMSNTAVFTTLEAAGLEESGWAPQSDFNSVPDMVDYWSDGEDSRYEMN